jgi:molybdopterin-guanine dinucleotide biosynthesis protein A
MHGLILAGGEGTRLAADGVRDPKAAVVLGGQAQILRLVETLRAVGCPAVTCMVRDDAGPAFDALARLRDEPRVHVAACHTPSSLHTLVEGVRLAPRADVFCAMVDTVMRRADWAAVYEQSGEHLADGADAVLAVTPYVDDERPLWVERDASGMVRRLGGPAVDPPCVSGGVYAFGLAAQAEAVRAQQDGCTRMREFLSRLVADGARVATVHVERIVDVDHKRDLDAASALVMADAE